MTLPLLAVERKIKNKSKKFLAFIFWIVFLSVSCSTNPKDSAKAYNNRGADYNIKGQYDLAIQDCSKAIEIDPEFAMAYQNRGLAYKAKGQSELAHKDFDKALEFDPNIFDPNIDISK
jgi:tetratricopeptide (TPR) repeat protein